MTVDEEQEAAGLTASYKSSRCKLGRHRVVLPLTFGSVNPLDRMALWPQNITAGKLATHIWLKV